MCFEAVRMREVARYIRRDEVLIVDLRDKEEYSKGHVPGAKNFPYDEEIKEQEKWNIQFKDMVALHQKNISRELEEILVYCERGNISLLVARNLNKEGLNVKNLYGGYIAYKGVVERKYID